MQNRSNWLVTATASALAAGRAILEVYESPDMGVQKKADDSPLTLADRRAHDIIMVGIGGFGIPVLSEEGRNIPFAERSQWPRMWIVDPLDGTKEFIKRNGEFTVNIALAEAGIPTMGVIYVPVADTLYFSDLELGAFKIDSCQTAGIHEENASGMDNLESLVENASRLPLEKDKDRPFTIMGSRSHATPELEAYVEAMRQTRPGGFHFGRQFSEDLPGRRRRCRRLPPIGSHHGVGYRGRPGHRRGQRCPRGPPR
jgi:3'(2'), 5'-bisphosphate nucleotidase